MKKKKYTGFSLIELLIAVAIMLIVGTIVTSVLFVSLRTSSKSETTLLVKQNGEFALSQMTKSIRFAKQLDSPASCVTPVTQLSVTITSFLDGGQTTFSCSGSTIASNGASLIDTTAVTASGCSFICSQTSSSQPPTITIQFTLNARTTSSFVETTATAPFKTSVTMRNFAQ